MGHRGAQAMRVSAKNQGISWILNEFANPLKADFQSSALPTELPRQDIGRGYETATSYSNEAVLYRTLF